MKMANRLNVVHKIPGETTSLLRAISFAAEQHRDHRRKGETAAPYINHPITVAMQLAEAGLEDNTDLLMAAVLHDVIEDTETTYRDLVEGFGSGAADIVMEVSDDKSLEEKERKRVAVKTIAKKSGEARLLKLSDMIANVYDVIHNPPNWSRERKLRYFDWSERMAGAIRGTHRGLEKRLGELLAEGRAGLLGK